MSRGGRGMRGGRGRFGRGSVTHDLIRDNMEDLGVDAFQADDRLPPPLFPTVEQAFPPDLTADDEFIMGKTVALTHKFRAAASYLSREKIAKSKGSGHVDFDVDALFSEEDRRKYLPAELVVATGSMKNGSKSSHRQSDIFSKLEAAEGSAGQKGEGSGEKKEGEGSDEEVAEENEEEFLDEDDYMVDHYASDNDNDDNDDHEATF